MKKKILNFAILVFAFYLLFSLGRQVYETWHKRGQVQETEKTVEELRIKNQELRKKLDNQSQEGFIEREAREKLGMVKPGETIVILDKSQLGKKEGQKGESFEILPAWRQWIKLLQGG